MKDQELESLLKQAFRQADAHIDNNGFTEKVVSALPKRRRLGKKRLAILLGVWSAGLALAAIFLGDGLSLVVGSILDVVGSPVSRQAPAISSVVIVGLLLWGAVAAARARS